MCVTRLTDRVTGYGSGLTRLTDRVTGYGSGLTRLGAT